MAKIKISTVLFIIGTLLIISSIYSIVLKPSYVSYSLACNPELSNKLFPNSIILGSTTTFINEYGEREIKVEIKDTGNIKKDKRTLKHELVHVSQIKRNFPLIGCNTPIQKYFAEVEAYSLEYLPDRVFYVFYDKLE